MSYVLSIRPEAASDISEAYLYYQNCRVGLGSDFMLCVEETLERVSRNPLQYQVVHNGIRRVVTHRFPFGVFYLVAESRIIVIAVMNTMRDPSQWHGRA